jgi:N-formylglutamate deformylase
MTKLPVLISIPHGGWKVPDELLEFWALSPAEVFHDGDPYTPQIFDFADRVVAQVTMEYFRAAIDLNRAPDDCAPENPDGVLKSLTCYDVPVYRDGFLPGPDLKQRLLDRYYHPYHRFLDETFAGGEVKLGIDCHSMAAVSPPNTGNPGQPRPLICLGNLGGADARVCPPYNRLSCEPQLLEYMRDRFANVFQHEDVDIDVPATATMNVPFSGGHITRTMGYHELPFVQIEMSRALYLATPHFDAQKLTVDQERLRDLNEKIWRVIEATVRHL